MDRGIWSPMVDVAIPSLGATEASARGNEWVPIIRWPQSALSLPNQACVQVGQPIRLGGSDASEGHKRLRCYPKNPSTNEKPGAIELENISGYRSIGGIQSDRSHGVGYMQGKQTSYYPCYETALRLSLQPFLDTSP